MQDVIVLTRVMQLYLQNLHNVTSGPMFIQNHEFLGDLYTEIASDYDDLVERALGLSLELNLTDVHVQVGSVMQTLPLTFESNSKMFSTINGLEELLRQEIAAIYQASSIGTQQLIGEIANKSEKRSYKLKQLI